MSAYPSLPHAGGHFAWRVASLRIRPWPDIRDAGSTDSTFHGADRGWRPNWRSSAPSGKKRDVTGFFGFGGGVDILAPRHVALRTQVDVVWDHLFSDLLRNGRYTVRFSVGPAFNFGRNIAR